MALACDLELDTMDCCADATKWAWFTQYCVAARMAKAMQNRTPTPPKYAHNKRLVKWSSQCFCCPSFGLTL